MCETWEQSRPTYTDSACTNHSHQPSGVSPHHANGESAVLFITRNPPATRRPTSVFTLRTLW
jgi:hypothetical protein